MRHHNIAFLFVIMSIGMASAQSNRLERANEAMADLDYMSAILMFQQILQDEDNLEAKINLAEAYRKVNDSESAEYWYAQVVGLPDAKPIYKLHYGMMLQANGKCDLAKLWFKQYQKEVPDDARGKFMASACDMQDELLNKNKGIYLISHLPLNSRYDDFAPALLNHTLIFSSDREVGTAVKRTNSWNGNPFTQMFKCTFDPKGHHPGTFVYNKTEKFSKALDSKYHEAAVAFSPDQKTIYFTRNNYYSGRTGRSEDGLIKLKIFTGLSDGNGDWEITGALPFNSDEFHVAHPTLSPDGQRLYFSSNRPGGFGGMDLYYSDLHQDTWGPPINLGPVINTEGNEIFPFIDQGNRLYFASNGHIGLGGLDIFYSTPSGVKKWNVPVNLGAPINSNSDDFAICFGPTGEWGFFSSDREGGVGGDDIYGFQKSALPVEVLVLDEQTLEPLSGVSVVNSLTGVNMMTGVDGKVAFDMKISDCAVFSASKKGYDLVKKDACATKSSGDITLVSVMLTKQALYSVQGLVFDGMNGLPASGVQVFLINDCGKSVPEAVITSGDGRFKFKLDRECCYTVRAVKDGYISDIAEDVCTRGVAKNTTLKQNLSLQPFRDEEGFALVPGSDQVPKPGRGPRYNNRNGLYENPDGSLATANLEGGLVVKEGVLYDNGKAIKPETRTWEMGTAGYVVNIYYDYDASFFRQESSSDLEKLLKTLEENPGLQVEIASHTDSRGKTEYNQELSQRRADIVVDWLVNNGIDRSRLTAKGYGESRPVNSCNDNIPCSEEEYQINRRTEFTIVGQIAISKKNQNASLLQVKPSTKTKVPSCEGCPF